MPNPERVDFLGISLAYTDQVLTPRLETEALVLGTAARLYNRAAPSVLIDVGTGSGAIALSSRARFPIARLYAVDLSPSALDVARENARNNGIEVAFSTGSLLDGFLTAENDFQNDQVLVIANLPYIGEDEEIGEDVRTDDPAMALYGGGKDGFGLIRQLLEQGLVLASRCQSLHMSLEFGHVQLPLVLEWAAKYEIAVESWSDYSGVPRFAMLEYGHR